MFIKILRRHLLEHSFFFFSPLVIGLFGKCKWAGENIYQQSHCNEILRRTLSDAKRRRRAGETFTTQCEYSLSILSAVGRSASILFKICCSNDLCHWTLISVKKRMFNHGRHLAIPLPNVCLCSCVCFVLMDMHRIFASISDYIEIEGNTKGRDLSPSISLLKIDLCPICSDQSQLIVDSQDKTIFSATQFESLSSTSSATSRCFWTPTTIDKQNSFCRASVVFRLSD